MLTHKFYIHPEERWSLSHIKLNNVYLRMNSEKESVSVWNLKRKTRKCSTGCGIRTQHWLSRQLPCSSRKSGQQKKAEEWEHGPLRQVAQQLIGTCSQPWHTDFNPRGLHNERRDPNPKSCLLTASYPLTSPPCSCHRRPGPHPSSHKCTRNKCVWEEENGSSLLCFVF